jgi:hypothetical protein
MEIIRLLVDSTRDVDSSASPEFLRQIEGLSQEYEEVHVKRTVEPMKVHEKPVIDVSLAGTDLGTVRPVESRRYSGVFYQTPENAEYVPSEMFAYQRFIDRL